MKTTLRKMILFTALIVALTGCSKKEEVVSTAPLTIASATAQATGTWKATQYSIETNGATNKFTPSKGEMLQITASNVKLYSSSGFNSLFTYKIGNDSGAMDAFDLLYTLQIPTAEQKLAEKAFFDVIKSNLGTDNYFSISATGSDFGFFATVNGTKLTAVFPLAGMTVQFEKQ